MRETQRRITDALGVVVDCHGSSLSEAADRMQLLDLVAEFDLVVLRNVNWTRSVDEFSRLANSLGSVHVPEFLESEEGYPGIARVLRRPGDAGLTYFAGQWHSDWSYLNEPPQVSLLAAVTVPPKGGDTVWANQAWALEWMSEGFADTLSKLYGIHRASHSYGRDAGYSDDDHVRSMRIHPLARDEDRTAIHSVIRYDVLSARRHLYVNSGYCQQFENWTLDESRPLIRYLHRWCSYEEFSARHSWEEGDIVIWNNLTLIHRVLNDHDAARRELYRANLYVDRT